VPATWQTQGELSAHLEHELRDDFSLRGSYVLKAARRGIQQIDENRAFAYTIPFTFHDNGEDNLPGTADDQTIELFDRDPGVSEDRVLTNPVRVGLPDDAADYQTLELSLHRRFRDKWMLLTSSRKLRAKFSVRFGSRSWNPSERRSPPSPRKASRPTAPTSPVFNRSFIYLERVVTDQPRAF
jgi:hypothetical protein